MRTPRFSVNQDSKYLLIDIHAPYCDLQDVDVDIENENFMFYCKPYFLRLQLPGKVKDSDTSCGKFDADTQMFNFKVEKCTNGEFFPDLDMITKLLQPKSSKNAANTIEVISSNNQSDEDSENESDKWYLNQEIPNEEEKCLVLKQGYGFGNKLTSYLKHIQDPLFGILDDIAAIDMTQQDRKNGRIHFESNSFDNNIYLYQYFNDEDIIEIVNFPSPWAKLEIDKLEYTEYEMDILKELPNKEFLLSVKEENEVILGLVDILFAYCYDKRTFGFENSVESGWATNKISSTLSWFDTFQTLNEVIVAGFRRSLCFPLHRNFKLSMKVLEDLKMFLHLGKKFILKCFLEIHLWFNMGTCTDPRYILNDLYIKDYCIFIQKCNFTKLNKIIVDLDKIEIAKENLGLNLVNIEHLAVQEILNSSMDSSSSCSSFDSDDDSSSSTDSDDVDCNLSVINQLAGNLDSLIINSNEKFP